MALPIRRRASSPGAVLRGLDPFADFEKMWDQMGRYLEQAAAPAAGGTAWLPMAEEEESDDSYTVKVELPGYPAENIDIEVEGDELVISGELSEEHQGNVLTRRHGSFMYRTSLPAGADAEHCNADLDNGVLTVTIPKTTQQQRRKIEIGKGHHSLEGKSSSELAGESGLTPVEAHNTFVAGSTAATTGAQSSTETTGGTAPTGTA
ncbi:Hsp20/alpha crystallin family protein [Streptomyces sp. ISL-94]|uniref:Hsp20/alpha crystallin family protein n=1 Tax=Streptomyces sp. ISL-94 TaxID=2819190 RepID=UPI001BE9C692|nr:Hsp20/alpha crystallin family protein [Streptomyces sp. ISL-94]MBT2480096.1 Hsp20/alpha crystallin family protein [Streptomyces sp. ISL-94]